MGATVCGAVQAAPDLVLAAAIDPAGVGRAVAGSGVDGPALTISAELDALADASVDVAVDFTVPGAAVHNALWCAGHAINSVIGTTGIDDAGLESLARAFPSGGRIGCFVAPNFAIGAVLMIRFAELAAPWFDTAEIVELHHDAKVDAPSGTALLTAARMAAASGEWAGDPTEVEVLPGARGGTGAGGIHIHSIRLRGLVAHQEVLLGAPGQSLTIRHDSYDRQSFMPGVLLAVREVVSRPGVTVGLEQLLGI
jgi:4-hydroxy-tetrahydrodipicolinate reductase